MSLEICIYIFILALVGTATWIDVSDNIELKRELKNWKSIKNGSYNGAKSTENVLNSLTNGRTNSKRSLFSDDAKSTG